MNANTQQELEKMGVRITSVEVAKPYTVHRTKSGVRWNVKVIYNCSGSDRVYRARVDNVTFAGHPNKEELALEALVVSMHRDQFPCGKCDGAKKIREYGHYANGVCFECGGTGIDQGSKRDLLRRFHLGGAQ